MSLDLLLELDTKYHNCAKSMTKKWVDLSKAPVSILQKSLLVANAGLNVVVGTYGDQSISIFNYGVAVVMGYIVMRGYIIQDFAPDNNEKKIASASMTCSMTAALGGVLLFSTDAINYQGVYDLSNVLLAGGLSGIVAVGYAYLGRKDPDARIKEKKAAEGLKTYFDQYAESIAPVPKD